MNVPNRPLTLLKVTENPLTLLIVTPRYSPNVKLKNTPLHLPLD